MTMRNVGAELPFRREHTHDADGKRRTGSAVFDHERAEVVQEEREKHPATPSNDKA